MDKTSLAELFDACLAQWGIEGQCRPADGEMLGINLELADGTAASLVRDTTTGSRLPVWRLCVDDRRPVEGGSLRMILGYLRTELDEGYQLGKVIIGIQPEVAQARNEA